MKSGLWKKEGGGTGRHRWVGSRSRTGSHGPWDSLIEAVGSRHQPPGTDDGGTAEVFVILPKADLPGELPGSCLHAAHDPAGRPPGRLPATVCKAQDHQPGQRPRGNRHSSFGPRFKVFLHLLFGAVRFFLKPHPDSGIRHPRSHTSVSGRERLKGHETYLFILLKQILIPAQAGLELMIFLPQLPSVWMTLPHH